MTRLVLQILLSALFCCDCHGLVLLLLQGSSLVAMHSPEAGRTERELEDAEEGSGDTDVLP